MKLYVSVLVAVVNVILVVYGYPSGAPDMPTVCSQMLPDHGVGGQTGPSPFQISPSTITPYSPNQLITVTLSSLTTTAFEGFLLQARENRNGVLMSPIGSFTNLPIVAKQTCSTNGGSSITHTSNAPQTNIAVTWTAPNNTSSVSFLVTFVQSKVTFWLPAQLQGPGSTSNSTSGIDTSTCGRTKSCYRIPTGCSASSCQYSLTWANTSAGIAFELSATSTSTPSAWVALGLSTDTQMGDDSVTECVYNENKMTIQMSWNSGHSSNALPDGTVSLVPGSTSGGYSNGLVYCRFTRVTYAPTTSTATGRRRRQASASNIYYPGTTTYTALIATGPATAGVKSYHGGNKIVSPQPINFTASPTDMSGQSGANPLLKAHAILMLFAWMVCASFGVLLPRYYKQTWPKSKLCGKAIWFQLHQPIMIAVLVLTTIGFILIFVKTSGRYEQLQAPTNAHPPLGIIVMILVIINPVMAAFRCDPNAKMRPIFNIFHSVVGFLAHFASAVVILLGMYMQELGLPDWCKWVVVGWICWQIFIEIILLAHQHYLKCQGTNEEDDSKTHVEPSRRSIVKQKPTASIFKTVIGAVHLAGVISCAIAISVQIGSM